MKKFACLFVALLGLALTADTSRAADWGSAHYGGYQPWWNIFAKRNHCMSAEEERLQRFWHDYYDALRRYYGMLDRIDWVAYYKNHGYQINNGGYGCGPGGGSQRIQFAPVFVSPTMQWAVPNSGLGGAPMGPGYPPPGAFPSFGAGPGFGGNPGFAGAPGFPGAPAFGGGYGPMYAGQ
jgi:hypothetical protein